VFLDPPPIRDWIMYHLGVVSKFSERNSLLIKTIVLPPPKGKDFFSLVLERGWSLPVFRGFAPWCVKEMKTRPTAKLIKKIIKENNFVEYAYATGVRARESIRRLRSAKRLGITDTVRRIKMEYIGEITHIAPIYWWTDEDVIEYLEENISNIFGGSYKPLLDLYKRHAVEGKRLRTGCWICPQVKDDYFLESYSKEHPEYRIILETRRRIIEISENPKYRTGPVKNGYPTGRITLEGRRLIALELKKLIETKIGYQVMKPYIDNTGILSLIEKYTGEKVTLPVV
jgi:3'-phosphoadenosine 5'-phosphosulfate sulfotransferase (PAPS reductase)/FAD synthetase